MNLSKLKKKYIEALYREKAFIIKKDYIKLHHGGESHLYLNHSIFLSSYDNFDLLSQIYMQLLPKSLTYYKLGSVDSIMSPVICGFLAAKLKKDIVITKEKKVEHGIENKIYGDTKDEIILIDDVTTTGTILVNATKALRDKGSSVRFAILSACRDQTAIERLKSIGITTNFVTTYEEVTKILWNTLTREEKDIIIQEVREKNYNWNLN
ncbi:hypothetical protein HY029_05275 [Candidatus Gottesmanbacteria bacterium]|nr:hypothetical protein [Candidatus Gottesmanbacteria bacterium]